MQQSTYNPDNHERHVANDEGTVSVIATSPIANA